MENGEDKSEAADAPAANPDEQKAQPDAPAPAEAPKTPALRLNEWQTPNGSELVFVLEPGNVIGTVTVKAISPEALALIGMEFSAWVAKRLQQAQEQAAQQSRIATLPPGIGPAELQRALKTHRKPGH